jgi:hypothetical protein
VQDRTCPNNKKSQKTFAKKERKFFPKISLHLIHDSAGGEQIRGSLHHHGIVEVELHEGVLPCMIAVERPAAHSYGLSASVPVRALQRDVVYLG